MNTHWFARLVPESWRWAHHWYANVAGYFWLPCNLCSKPTAGHEWRNAGGHMSSTPDLDDPHLGHGICPACTRAGLGDEAWTSRH